MMVFVCLCMSLYHSFYDILLDPCDFYAMGATEAGSKDVEALTALTALAVDQGDDVSWWVQKAQIQGEMVDILRM